LEGLEKKERKGKKKKRTETRIGAKERGLWMGPATCETNQKKKCMVDEQQRPAKNEK